MSYTEYLFGAWTIGIFLSGLWLGRKSKWEEKENLAPRISNPISFNEMNKVDQVIEDRMTPHPLGVD